MQIDIFVAQQFLFQRQWQRVRSYAHELGISIMGDMPIYVGYHSADVWANKKSFLLVRNPIFMGYVFFQMLLCYIIGQKVQCSGKGK
jgi:4-alpha-glucanotransferase